MSQPTQPNLSDIELLRECRNTIDKLMQSEADEFDCNRLLARIDARLAQPEADDAPVGRIPTLAEMREILKAPEQPEAAEPVAIWTCDFEIFVSESEALKCAAESPQSRKVTKWYAAPVAAQPTESISFDFVREILAAGKHPSKPGFYFFKDVEIDSWEREWAKRTTVAAQPGAMAAIERDAARYRARRAAEWEQLARALPDGHTTSQTNHAYSYDAHSESLHNFSAHLNAIAAFRKESAR